jgi:hypothetical protein
MNELKPKYLVFPSKYDRSKNVNLYGIQPFENSNFFPLHPNETCSIPIKRKFQSAIMSREVRMIFFFKKSI